MKTANMFLLFLIIINFVLTDGQRLKHLTGVWANGYSYSLLSGVEISTAFLEGSMSKF